MTRAPFFRITRRQTPHSRSAILGFALCSGALLLFLATPTWASSEGRVPLAQIGDETIYVDEVEGALALRIFKHELDIYSLLVSEAERRMEAGLLAREAARRGTTVEALLADVEGDAASVSDADVESYLAEHPPRARADSAETRAATEQERERVRHYLSERTKIARRVAFLAKLREDADARVLLEPPVPPRTEIDLSGAPARGPEAAPVVIVQFTSLGSRNAARSARKIDQLRAEYPDKIRQVHLHFLRDRDEAGLAAARISTAATTSAEFWALHDAILAEEKVLSLERMLAAARSVGISQARARAALDDPTSLAAVKRDIDVGNAAGVPREPSLFINGRFLSGLVPYDEIKEIVAEELGR